MDAGALLRRARERRGLDQAALARRAGTTQSYVSRIERGDVSPSVKTLTRLLHSMGYELDARLRRLPAGNVSAADLRADFEQLSPSERIREAMALSEFLTDVAEKAGRE